MASDCFHQVAELGMFIDSMGHGFTVAELHEMIKEVGVREDEQVRRGG